MRTSGDGAREAETSRRRSTTGRGGRNRARETEGEGERLPAARRTETGFRGWRRRRGRRFPLYLTGARMRERRRPRKGAGAGAAGAGRAGRGRRTGVLGGWVLVRFSRGKRRRGVGAASGWCIIDPSVCGLGKKRSLRLDPRKRRSDTSAAHGAEKETPPRRPISQTDIRNAFASYPACDGTR